MSIPTDPRDDTQTATTGQVTLSPPPITDAHNDALRELLAAVTVLTEMERGYLCCHTTLVQADQILRPADVALARATALIESRCVRRWKMDAAEG